MGEKPESDRHRQASLARQMSFPNLIAQNSRRPLFSGNFIHSIKDCIDKFIRYANY